MEQETGVRLFDRQADGYVATAAGEQAIAVAGDLEEAVTALERRIVGHDLRPSGVVRLTTVEALLLEALPPAVDRFRAKHPEIALELVSSPAALNLSKRDADVAIRVTSSPPDLLVGRKLATVASAAYATPDCLARFERLTDVAAYDWIGYDESLAHLKAARWLARHLGEKRPAVRVNTVLAVKNMVEAGVGVGFMPCFLGDSSPRLERVVPPSHEWDSELWLLTHPDLRNVARVRAVMDHFGDELARLRPLFEGSAPTRHRDETIGA
jgi:DNA-binding transcriptional LysR family regulator